MIKVNLRTNLTKHILTKKGGVLINTINAINLVSVVQEHNNKVLTIGERLQALESEVFKPLVVVESKLSEEVESGKTIYITIEEDGYYTLSAVVNAGESSIALKRTITLLIKGKTFKYYEGDLTSKALVTDGTTFKQFKKGDVIQLTVDKTLSSKIKLDMSLLAVKR